MSSSALTNSVFSPSFESVTVHTPSQSRYELAETKLQGSTKKPILVTQNTLDPEDLGAAARLVKSGQYAQAMVLIGALQRLYGDNRELDNLIAVCRASQATVEKLLAKPDARSRRTLVQDPHLRPSIKEGAAV